MAAPVRAFLACSLDGFIAGPDDDLSWLPQGDADEDYGFAAFMAETGALLMGRRTYDVVAGFAGPWPYGDVPVLVTTTHPLDPVVPTVRAVRGTPQELVAAAQAVTERGVYVDGGVLIRQVLGAGLLDELTVSVVPYVLGAGVPLLAGAARRPLRLVRSESFRSGLVQLVYAVDPV